MEPSFYKAIAPGSIIILGEHAVLHGYKSVVAAIDARITVCLEILPTSPMIYIESQMGSYKTSIDKIPIVLPFSFVLKACSSMQKHFSCGFRLTIHSEIDPTTGFGSSAAVTVATLAVLHQWQFKNIERTQLFNEALDIIQYIQGVGSGADLAASLYGGVLEYQMDAQPKPLPFFGPLGLIYVGYKTKTAEVIRWVQARFKSNPDRYHSILQEIGRLAEEGSVMIQKGDKASFANLMHQHQICQNELGVCDERTQTILNELASIETIQAAKISGSGLGDCILTLGQIPIHYFEGQKKWQEKNIREFYPDISKEGLVLCSP